MFVSHMAFFAKVPALQMRVPQYMACELCVRTKVLYVSLLSLSLSLFLCLSYVCDAANYATWP